MKKGLTDTHTLVWALTTPEKLSDRARSFLQEGQVMASVANLWELLIKKSRPGGLVQDPIPWWRKFVVGSGIQVVGIRSSHMVALDRLPDLHKDPFDRIMVAQAITEGAAFVTKDSQLARYEVPIVW